MAPISLCLVSFMLYFFRFVYSEVVTAMPVNGGSYNALLNTTSKRIAAIAACLSLISYVATAVVSGCYAVIYLKGVWETADVHLGTIILLAFFACLTLLGVGESSVVATGMFALHCVALLLLVVWSFIYGARDHWATWSDNWASPYPDIVDSSGSVPRVIVTGGPLACVFFGYAAALLGITGFETAANYVEEMADGRTYVNTLRNMWWAAGVLNPVISLGVMAVLPMNTIMTRSEDLLLALAQQLGGPQLANFIAVDAFIVLAGSVLTAYVGVIGLVRRLALDRCLPDFLMHLNKARGTPHYIILVFFVLTSSLFLALYPPSTSDKSRIDDLGGVYDIAFLSVMSAFAGAAIIQKWKRPDLPRLVIASWPTVLIALSFVLAGLVLNIVKGPGVLAYFVLYFGAALAIVFTMFNRTTILRLVYYIVRSALATRAERERVADKARQLRQAHEVTEAVRLVHLHGPDSVSESVKTTLLKAAQRERGTGDSVGSEASPRTGTGAGTLAGTDESVAGASSTDGAVGGASAASPRPPGSARGAGGSSISLARAPTVSVILDPLASSSSSVGVGLVALPPSTAAQSPAAWSSPSASASSSAESGARPASARGPSLLRLPSTSLRLTSSTASADTGTGSEAGATAGSAGGEGTGHSVALAVAPAVVALPASLALLNADGEGEGAGAHAHVAPAPAPSTTGTGTGGGGFRFLASLGRSLSSSPADGSINGPAHHASASASASGRHGSMAAISLTAIRPSNAASASGDGYGALAGDGDGEEGLLIPPSASATSPTPSASGLRQRSTLGVSVPPLSAFGPNGRPLSVASPAARRAILAADPSRQGNEEDVGEGDGDEGEDAMDQGSDYGDDDEDASASGGYYNTAGSPTHLAAAEAAIRGSSTAPTDALLASAASPSAGWRGRLYGWLTRSIASINAQPVVFFAKRPDLPTLNKAVLYVRGNETTSRIVVVHVVDDRQAVQELLTDWQSQAQADLESTGPGSRQAPDPMALLSRLPPLPPSARLLRDNCALLDAMYPKVRIDCLLVRGSFFSPPVIAFLADYLRVAPNLMFMAQPDPRFPHQYAAMGGVRVITRPPSRKQRRRGTKRLLHVLTRIVDDGQGAGEGQGDTVRGGAAVPAS